MLIIRMVPTSHCKRVSMGQSIAYLETPKTSRGLGWRISGHVKAPTFRGQWPYRRASEAKSGFRFEISDSNYLYSMCKMLIRSLMMNSEATLASKQHRSNLTQVYIASKWLFAGHLSDCTLTTMRPMATQHDCWLKKFSTLRSRTNLNPSPVPFNSLERTEMERGWRWLKANLH